MFVRRPRIGRQQPVCSRQGAAATTTWEAHPCSSTSRRPHSCSPRPRPPHRGRGDGSDRGPGERRRQPHRDPLRRSRDRPRRPVAGQPRRVAIACDDTYGVGRVDMALVRRPQTSGFKLAHPGGLRESGAGHRGFPAKSAQFGGQPLPRQPRLLGQGHATGSGQARLRTSPNVLQTALTARDRMTRPGGICPTGHHQGENVRSSLRSQRHVAAQPVQQTSATALSVPTGHRNHLTARGRSHPCPAVPRTVRRRRSGAKPARLTPLASSAPAECIPPSSGARTDGPIN
jgi:hypothetical protein